MKPTISMRHNVTVQPVSEKPLIAAKDLAVKKQGTTICHVPELTITAGERVGIMGGNGSGKTTLLRVLAGLEHDHDGICQVATEPRERVFVHQAPYLMRGTVLFNVAYGLAARGVATAERNASAHSWLAQLGVDQLDDRRIANLSGGERRRVALARAFCLSPRLLLLDEPLADLDEAGIETVSAAIASLENTTVLISSPIPLPDGLVTRTVSIDSIEGMPAASLD